MGFACRAVKLVFIVEFQDVRLVIQDTISISITILAQPVQVTA
jgi:hypothetical protein